MGVAPYFARIFLSDTGLQLTRKFHEVKRKLRKENHRFTVFLAIDDPHSYLLLQVLPELQKRFGVELEFRTVLNRQEEMFPAPELWDANAFKDCQFTAKLYGLSFPDQPPSSDELLKLHATAQLLHNELQPEYLENALSIFESYWFGRHQQLDAEIEPVIKQRVECYRHHLKNNEDVLKKLHHYLSGTIFYGGEWYWSIDRLFFLEQRLNVLLNTSPESQTLLFDRTFADFPDIAETKADAGRSSASSPKAIQVYWSLRSPYSYIGLVRVRKLAEKYGVEVEIKPVLPMVMRRMQVPPTKKFYIIKDVKREANRYGIEFGFISDPLGAGVERCYALYQFAKDQGKGNQYLEACARAAWAEGTDLSTNKGLKRVVESVELDWRGASTQVNDQRWRFWAQENLLELYSKGLWGVPSFSYGDTSVFGQDKLIRIESIVQSTRVNGQ
ncbi:disulfide bond formation protein DsbA [Veronia nyctiphanis]|uniref:Disulfide bond formation protein DsbA n=1 Tax=Veronia nyctiphanis TaxID=1278244 RepID=A0A4Q0YMR2_9GAMM|nr:DsbA family protein [Veronia nyctiphanis]RXJ71723.1 disulfide bond formation protein DsbA [Veronia nyctiphanis]